MSVLAREILCRLRKVLGNAQKQVPLHEPCFRGREKEYLCECVETGWVSSVGKFVDRFEAELAAFTGAKRAVAIVNGTCALQLALRLAGVKPGDEVLVPSLTFVATANAVTHLGAIPHFVDSEWATFGVGPEPLGAYLDVISVVRDGVCVNRATGRRIAAVVPMHVFGHAVRLSELLDVAQRHGVVVVEDAAESLGTRYKNVHTGLWGKLGVLSFNGNKTITTGGGGAILCMDEAIAAEAKHLSTTAKIPHRWAFEHDAVAYNFRMPNINAALGCAQLEQLPGFLERKRGLARVYAEVFADMDEVQFVTEPKDSVSNYWLSALLLSEKARGSLEEVLDVTNSAGVMTRPAWDLISSLAIYSGCPKADLPVATNLVQRLINIPSGPMLVPMEN